jgi:hypothetical protein
MSPSRGTVLEFRVESSETGSGSAGRRFWALDRPWAQQYSLELVVRECSS